MNVAFILRIEVQTNLKGQAKMTTQPTPPTEQADSSGSNACSEVIPTDEWDTGYWAFNCPLQMWGNAKDGWRVVNYMPRKERCSELDERVTVDEMPQFCRNASARLRNLASLFDAMADGKIDMIYYPDEVVEEAMQSKNEDD